MAIKIKSAADIAKKFAARAGAAGSDYAAGVSNPARSWQEATVASAQNYATGVQQSIADGRFAKGVTKAGDDKYKRKAAGVGAQRYPSGVAAAAPDYQTGVQPFLDTLANVNLPPRFPKGDPQNAARTAAVNQALRAKKVSG